jgi:hypothetical protein
LDQTLSRLRAYNFANSSALIQLNAPKTQDAIVAESMPLAFLYMHYHFLQETILFTEKSPKLRKILNNWQSANLHQNSANLS